MFEDIIELLKDCKNFFMEFYRIDARKFRDINMQAYNDPEIINMVNKENIYYDEERNFVIINDQGKHVKPKSLTTIEKYLFNLCPKYWIFHIRLLKERAVEVIESVRCESVWPVFSPNIYIPPREEWLNEKYMDELLEILALDNNTKETYVEKSSNVVEDTGKYWVKPYRFKELIRKSNPKFWTEKKGQLLLKISMEELNAISQRFDKENMVILPE